MINTAVEHYIQITYLHKANGSRLFTEALSAKVESVLADKTSLVGAKAAKMMHQSTWPTSERARCCRMDNRYSPLTAALAVFSGTREPNSVVGHIGLLVRLL